MTRKEIESEYTVENGMIRSPGKFEGQCVYMPNFYEDYLDGFADEQAGGVLSVEVDENDKAQFPELKKRKRIRFIVTDQGFVTEV